MALIDHIDGLARDIYLSADTVDADIHPIDIYKEMRALRRTDESLRKFDVFLEAKGNEPKGGGKFTERYVICKSGTRIIPFDVTHTLTVSGTIITDDGQSGIACFDRTPLTSTTVVDINYQPPQVEVVTVNVNGGGGGGDVTNVSDIANAVAAKFLFNGSGHVLSEAVGVTVGQASIDETQLNRVIQGAIPPPPSNGAIAKELAKLMPSMLPKQKDWSKELKAIEQKLEKLSKPEPKSSDLADAKQMFRIIMNQLQPTGDQELLQSVREINSKLDLIPTEQQEAKDHTEEIDAIKTAIELAQKAILKEVSALGEKVNAIPEPDLSGLATKSEVAALNSLVSKLSNYDDARVQSRIGELISLLQMIDGTTDRTEQKVDLLLDSQA